MKNNGFSLLELSIVLVIIGLIAGGIVAGASMIRAAELRAVVTELDQHKIAIFTFRDKYLGLPGDLKNATSFWGVDPDGCPGDHTDTTPTQATCNGDGNGQIGREPGGASLVHGDAENLESFRAWQHLANAELTSGNYTGSPEEANFTQGKIGLNIPQSKLQGGGFNIHYDTAPISDWLFDDNYNNFLLFGSDVYQSTFGATLTNEEAWNIDKKIDDGRPGLGNVKTLDNSAAASGGNCADSNTSDAEYQLGISDIACTLTFELGF